MFDADPNETAAAQASCANTRDADNVTVAVTSAAPPASETSTVAEFMSAVVPWPGPDDPPSHHIGVHIQKSDRDPTKPLILYGGAVCHNVTELIHAAQQNENRSDVRGQFFSTTLQSRTKTSKWGKPYAERTSAGAIGAKSIFIDIDLDPADPAKYPDAQTAWAAIQAMIATGSLPMPSAVVVSGHGMHFYWISKVGLTMPEWHEYSSGLKNMMLAQGVKIDPVCTGDAARVLRIPGTTNRKLGKTPVVAELMPLPAMKLYDFPTTFAHLIPLAAPPPATKAAYNPFYSDSDWGGVKQPAGAFAELKGLPDDLSAGWREKEEYLVPIAPIFEQCGFYKEALANKGKNNKEPQWHLAILGTTFMENGRAVAHAISEGYSTYTEAETDEKYDLKLATRQARRNWVPKLRNHSRNWLQVVREVPAARKGEVTPQHKAGCYRHGKSNGRRHSASRTFVCRPLR